MNKLIMFLVLFATLRAFNVPLVKANNSVGLSATVVEKKPTDTINDFDFSEINYITQEYKNINSSQQQVKGAYDIDLKYTKKFFNFIKMIIGLI